MLGNMLWGTLEPLICYGCTRVAPEYSLVCCSGLDYEEGIIIIHFWAPIAFNDYILVFTYYNSVLVKGNYTFIVK